MTVSIKKEMIEELKELMEDDFPLLLNTFLDDSNKRLVDLKFALAENNANEVRELAHGFKGSSANLGAEKLAEISSDLETMGRTEQLSGAESRFEELNNEYKIILEYFNSLLT
ncbi:MAG: HPt (histidine-containing phosphotransfer) domain-containing protein [Enterobacterales bacterium]|jgi:HPt (histidine-containing phosphotransfer) domain-containing protein